MIATNQIILLLILGLSFIHTMASFGMVGGYTRERQATEEIKEMCEKVRADVEKSKDTEYSMFEAVSFKSQVVAGMNYEIKVQTSDDSSIWIKVFVPLPRDGEAQEPQFQRVL